ncbi:unnamed protein product [Arabidopsis lyrata]|uniref:Defensin-like protein n=1 Tax=Arabidopsis lyrata subsp. lyrata TaxID=81972 RepID=D7MK12_ARALL|nr:low-molecular-weight cysteine-rich 58 [Arabidopsis lyrata subsp. lyrata]CAH8277400.1 unnamed protein product [Arabidopsis lyrata]
MKRIPSLVFFASLLIIFVTECVSKYSYFYMKFNKVYNALVVNQTRAISCDESLGLCKKCDERCKAKHGPSCISKCDGEVGMLSCTCTYECGPTLPPKRNVCSGGTGMCSGNCPDKCCDTNCAQKYNGGRGFCNSLGNYNLCQCEYPC